MSKLQYKTKAPRKGYVFNQSFMSHKSDGWNDLPPIEIQEKAHRLVLNSMEKLIKEMSELGYDPTRAGFYIHFKN